MTARGRNRSRRRNACDVSRCPRRAPASAAKRSCARPCLCLVSSSSPSPPTLATPDPNSTALPLGAGIPYLRRSVIVSAATMTSHREPGTSSADTGSSAQNPGGNVTSSVSLSCWDMMAALVPTRAVAPALSSGTSTVSCPRALSAGISSFNTSFFNDFSIPYASKMSEPISTS